jgi:hypothetical protein
MKGFWKIILEYQLKQLWDGIVWLGHPALGALTVRITLYLNPYIGVFCFLGYMRYQMQEFKEIQRLLRQGQPPASLGNAGDSCAIDTKHYLYGLYTWAIIEMMRRFLAWIPGLF